MSEITYISEELVMEGNLDSAGSSVVVAGRFKGELRAKDVLLEANSISEEERKNRNLLGLKIKGFINRKVLEENYKIRMRNYEESKLETMSASKRRTSLQKKERLQKAYDYLKALVNKES